MIIKKLLFLFFFIVSLALKAQFNLGYQYTPLSIDEGNGPLKSAAAGGFNTPHFNEIDLNDDGIIDLLVFDRSGKVIKTFLYNSGTSSYDYAPQYESQFPSEVREFLFLRDYNCDGFPDLWTFKQGSLVIFKNKGVFPLEWELITDRLESDYGSVVTNILVLSGDIPAIVDIDSDGDLDVLAFGLANAGNSITYHRNVSIEEFGHCDSLKYEMVTQCWGNIEEPENSSSLVQKFCKGAVPPGRDERLHPGSTLLLLDTDDDGDKDLVLGDIQTDRFVFAPNTGDAAVANIDINQQTTSWPADEPTRMEYLTSAFQVDVDHDGVQDLIASVNNTIDSSCNNENIWYYRNVSSTVTDFELQTQSFLLDEILDLGDGTCPVFVDINSDGLDDLIISSSYEKKPNSSRGSRLHYFRNTGSASNPSFVLEDNDFAGLSQFNFQVRCPAFGNLDSDGDLEMIIGDAEGNLHYFDNSPQNGVSNFTLTQPIYKGINSIGFHASPEIVDINNDGRNDILVGQQTGIVSYFENIGTGASADFSTQPTIEEFGRIDISELCCSGYASPRVVESASFGEGRFLFVGTDEKRIDVFRLSDNPNDSLPKIDQLTVNEGRVTPFFADINGDNNPDFIVGSQTGGVKFYTRDEDYKIGVLPVSNQLAISVFPNPAGDVLNFDTDQQIDRVEAYSLDGRLLKTWSNPNNSQLNVSELSSGLYLLRFHSEGLVKTERVILE